MPRFRVTLSKVRIEKISFSVWDGFFEASARAGELAHELGLVEDFETISFARSPVTGELIQIAVTREVESGT